MNRRTLATLTACVLSATASFAQNTNTLLPYGNVGIGTLLPTAKLQVNGSTLLQGLTVTGASVFQQNSIFNNQLSVVGATVLQGTTTIGQLKLPSLTVETTPAPGVQVLLRDPVTGTVTAAGLDVFDPFTVLEPQLCTEGYLALPRWVHAPNKIFIPCPQVSVGIGTNMPSQALHVTQNGLFNGSVQVDHEITIGDPNSFSSAEGHLLVRSHLGTALEVKFSNHSTTILKASNSSGSYTPFLLKANGQMIISSSPTQKILQLNPDGTLLARKIQIDVVAWPDYVFGESYKRMKIYDLEAYVKTFKHLPNVPSATETEANGIDLATMNKVLLEKTEEMTLYIIDQQHQLDEQQKQLEDLRKQVELLLNKQ